MKTKFFILAFVSVLFYTACNEKKNTQCLLETLLRIEFVDTNGVNLISNNTLDSNNFKVFYEIDGKKIFASCPNSDYSKGYSIATIKGNGPALSFGLNDGVFDCNDVTAVFDLPDGEYKTTTYLQLSENDTDTIVATFKKHESSVYYEDLWYNNKYYSNSEIFSQDLGSYIKVVK